MIMEPSWSIKLTQQLTHYTIANLPQPSFVYQGLSKHLLVHSKNQSTSLPIRKQILGLATIQSSQHIQQKAYSLVLLLTRYQLSCFDLFNNNLIYSLQFENAERLIKSDSRIYVICGSDLFCYTYQGEQQYVNHLSSNLDCIQPLKDGRVIVALDDMTMSQYNELNIKFQYGKVIGNICCMAWMGQGILIGSTEGTIAYYQSKKYKWKAKSSHKPLQIKFFQSQQQEKSYAIVIRENGLTQLRDWSTGATLNKLKLGQGLLGVTLNDFRSQGYEQLLAIYKNGVVKAFNIKNNDSKITKVNDPSTQLASERKAKQQNLEILTNLKMNLQYEVAKLKQQLSKKNSQGDEQGPIISPDFKMTANIYYEKGLILKIQCTNGFVRGLSFQQGILPILCGKQTQLKYTFSSQNKIAGEINCEALVHSTFRANVFEIKKFKVILPRFWRWGSVTQAKKKISNCVQFKMSQRNARYLKWMKDCFYINVPEQQLAKLQTYTVLKVRFLNYYEDIEMELVFASKQGRVQIWCDCLKTIGDLVQDLVNYVGLKQLDSQLSFPNDKQKIQQTLSIIEKLSQTKTSISSQMAQASNNIKFLLVKAQSSRVVGSMKELRKSYGQIMQQNRNLIAEVQKKNQNTKQLAESLKTLGQLINQVSNVRFGQPKTKVVTMCRQAIKNKDFPKIIKIMEQGGSS